MHFGLCLVVMTSLLVYFADGQSCSSNGISNGCSIPFNLPWFYKRRFRVSCNHHDICYNCGARYNTSRSECDYRFYLNMRSNCSNVRRITRGLCRLFARQYYNAVKRHGARRYRNPSPGWCRNRWTRQCSDL